MINEDLIINRLKESSAGFIGDDAAILPDITNNQYVITNDMLIENIHFRTKYFSPEDLAHKAIHVNLSDLAAMGANPLYILCGISVPSKLNIFAEKFLSFLVQSCNKSGIILIGGDTTSSQNDLIISITAIGESCGNIKFRNTAKNYDIICVVGNLGWAHLGFISLEQGIIVDEKYKQSFLRPTAKTKEGIWLASQSGITSMMDISDGLYIDLQRLCKNSNKKATLDINLIEKILSPEISIETALEGGEDYNLLITIKQELFHQITTDFNTHFNYKIFPIGSITSGHGIDFINNKHTLNINPFTHFNEKI